MYEDTSDVFVLSGLRNLNFLSSQWTSINLFLSSSGYVLERKKNSSLVPCSPCKDDSNDMLHYILTISLPLQKLRKEKNLLNSF